MTRCSYSAQHHSMATYCQNISWAYLEKSPAYTIPSIPKQPLEELNIVKPYVDVVEIHHHGTEMAVALEGSNLWFCYRVTVGGRSTNAPAPDISCNSIQFNISKDGNGLTVDNEGKEVKVSLENYFSSKPIKQDVPVYTKVSTYIDVVYIQNTYSCVAITFKKVHVHSALIRKATG